MTMTTTHGDRIQGLMNDFYNEWQKDENKSKDKWDILENFSTAHQIAVIFGNFNYQVGNGGIEQWVYNGYFYNDAEKFTEHLETGAEIDDRCRFILDKVYLLCQYAEETGCDRNGSYVECSDCGEYGSIGDMINGDTFNSWYYDKCGEENWWEVVCKIIEVA